MTLRALLSFAGASAIVFQSCTSTRHNSTSTPLHAKATHATLVAAPTPLVLAIDEGERRVRRFQGVSPTTIIKVDPQNGGSSDLVMLYTDIPPGGEITRHWHTIADEIMFVHRGSGVAELGDQKQAFGTGATVYIPKKVRVAVRNSGAETLSAVFIFSKPGFEQYVRETTVPEGQSVTPLSREELTEIRKRHEWHMVFEYP